MTTAVLKDVTRCVIGVVMVAIASCGGSQAQPATEVVVPDLVQHEPPEERPQAPIELRRAPVTLSNYSRRGHASLIDPSSAMPDFRFEVGGPLRTEARGHHLVEIQNMDTAHIIIDEHPPSGTPSGLDSVRIELFVDERNRVDEAHTVLVGSSGVSQAFLQEVAETLSVIRIVYPDRAIEPGDEWVGERYRWDTRPFGWVAANLSPSYKFVGVEEVDDDQVAVVEWRVDLEIEPFRAMHFHMAGEGVLLGESRIRVSDGITGKLELRGTVDLWAAASQGRPANPPLQIEVEIVQEVGPSPG